jgi:hypothetical protein
MEERNIEGRADRVIRRLINEGDIEQVLSLIGALIGDGHEISVAFRACLIGQGHEEYALLVNEAKLYFHDRGFMLQLDPRDDGAWIDNKTPEMAKAFDTALVWIMRAANIDAYIDDKGIVSQRGPIMATTPDAVEHLVGQFKDELDREFPDAPPPQREGKWW